MNEKFDAAIDAACEAVAYSIPSDMVEAGLRAALAVLREPDEKMKTAGVEGYFNETMGDRAVGTDSARAVYVAMIDAALK